MNGKWRYKSVKKYSMRKKNYPHVHCNRIGIISVRYIYMKNYILTVNRLQLINLKEKKPIKINKLLKVKIIRNVQWVR